MVRAEVHPDVQLPAILVLTTLIWYVEKASRPVTLVLVSGGDIKLLLAMLELKETLGSSQLELKNTLFSIARLERFCDSTGPRRKTSYFVITPVQKENKC